MFKDPVATDINPPHNETPCKPAHEDQPSQSKPTAKTESSASAYSNANNGNGSNKSAFVSRLNLDPIFAALSLGFK